MKKTAVYREAAQISISLYKKGIVQDLQASSVSLLLLLHAKYVNAQNRFLCLTLTTIILYYDPVLAAVMDIDHGKHCYPKRY